MSLAYHNGRFTEKTGIAVSPADYGFARGITAFELMRLYGGIPFRLDDHLDRLERSAKTLGIACPLNRTEITAVTQHLHAQNKYPHSAIKIYLTAGVCGDIVGLGFAACHDFEPSLIIMEDEVKAQHTDAPYGLELYRRGQRLKTVPFERELPSVKSINYMLGFYASREHAGKDWDEILFTHRDGYVTEATRSNFFCVIDGILCTPGQNMLHGITRKVVLELAARLGISVAEKNLTPADLARAAEAFTTGSIAELLPARQIDDHMLPTTTDGPVFKKLRQAFSSYITESCGSLAKAS